MKDFADKGTLRQRQLRNQGSKKFIEISKEKPSRQKDEWMLRPQGWSMIDVFKTGCLVGQREQGGKGIIDEVREKGQRVWMNHLGDDGILKEL